MYVYREPVCTCTTGASTDMAIAPGYHFHGIGKAPRRLDRAPPPTTAESTRIDVAAQLRKGEHHAEYSSGLSATKLLSASGSRKEAFDSAMGADPEDQGKPTGWRQNVPVRMRPCLLVDDVDWLLSENCSSSPRSTAKGREFVVIDWAAARSPQEAKYLLSGVGQYQTGRQAGMLS